MNKNCLAPYCVEPRLEEDIGPMFILNYFVFGQEISQRATLIIAVTSGGLFETCQITVRSIQVYELCRSSIKNRSP